jgi:Ca2+:H+ antiporter
LLLKARQIEILRASLLGAILTNLLLMTGISFFAGRISRLEQYFNATLAQTIGMLLLLAVLSIVIPTAAHSLTKTSSQGITQQSRGTAIVIMISYALWLIFQLKSNRALFENTDIQEQKTKISDTPREQKHSAKKALAAMGSYSASAVVGGTAKPCNRPEAEPEPEPILAFSTAIVLVVVSITIIAFNTEFAANSIQGLLTEAGISKTFTGLVIVPIISIDPMCISVARKDKMDMSISLTLERCMQTALMVIPFIILLAW